MKYVSMAYMDEETGCLVMRGAKGELTEFPPEFFSNAKTELDSLEFKAIYALEYLCKDASPPMVIAGVQTWGDIVIILTEQ